MATEAAWLECKESTGRKEKTERANRKRKTHLTHTGLLMEGLQPEIVLTKSFGDQFGWGTAQMHSRREFQHVR
jgi:hypothetical protein